MSHYDKTSRQVLNMVRTSQLPAQSRKTPSTPQYTKN